MRVGIVVDASLAVPGGVQEYVRGLYDHLALAGHSAAIITAPDAANPIDQPRRVLNFGHRLDMRRITPRASAAASLTWAGGQAIREMLARERFDVLHFMAPTGILANQILQQATTTTNVLTFLIAKDRPGLWPLATAIFRALWGRRLEPNVHGLSALSEPARQHGALWFPGPCSIIPAGIDPARFAPRPGQPRLFDDGKLTLLFVGRLDHRKGVHHLLQAYAAIRQERDGLRLVFVGAGPEGEAARQFVTDKQVADVLFAGKVPGDELPNYYRSADIFCAPSFENESFGVVLLEAMSAGLPIVGYANDGYASVLTGEARQALAEPGDVDALTVTLRRVIADRRLRERLSMWSRHTAEGYSWQSVGQRIIAFYRESAVQRPPPQR